MVLTETWLRNTDEDRCWLQCNELNRGNFKTQISNRKFRRGGGLALVHKSNIEVKCIKEDQLTTFQFAIWKAKFNNDNITLIAIYHPPYSAANPFTNTNFIDEYTEWLTEQIGNYDNLYITGDFNIHVNNTTMDDEASAFVDSMEALGLEQHCNFMTHKAGNTLDLVITETFGPLQVKACQAGNFISDHCIVQCWVSITRDVIQCKEVTYRKLVDINIECLVDDMKLEDLADIDELNALTELCDNRMKRSLEIHAPVQTKTITIRQTNPWFTEGVRSLKKAVRRQEKIWRKYKTNDTWSAYKLVKLEYRKALRQAKIEVISDKVQECNRDSKKLYSLFNSLTGTTKENPLPTTYANDEDMANAFADFFMDKIEGIRNSLEHHPIYHPHTLGHLTNELTEFNYIPEDDIKNTISRMANKSCELDPLPISLFKRAAENGKFLHTITKIVNLSLNKGQFANTWKTAIIRPLLKKAGLEIIHSNYRPISNLSFISKLTEKCFLNQFLEHCQHQKLLPDYQSAYRKNYSTETAIIKLCDDLLWAMEQQLVSFFIAIDLSAAFDTVDHNVLLRVLENNFGVGGMALGFCDTYLCPRHCKVNINKSYSTPRELPFSVPQGSCAGPVLYSVYALTIQHTITNDQISLYGYADDHGLRMTCRPEAECETNIVKDLQDCLSLIKDWMNRNWLKMNSSKTEIIIFGSRQQLSKVSTNSMLINGDKIDIGDCIKYLGVWADRHLTFKQHIKIKCRTAMWNLQKLKTIRPVLTIEAASTLAMGTIISHLDYCNGIYSGLPEIDLNKLQRVQNITAKIVLGKGKFADPTDCLKTLHWLPIKYRVEYKILCTVYKCLSGDTPDYLKVLLKEYTTFRQGLRSEQSYKRLVVPRTVRKTFASRSFSVFGPTLWNQIPNHLKELGSLDSFKKDLKTFLFNKAFNTNFT